MPRLMAYLPPRGTIASTSALTTGHSSSFVSQSDHALTDNTCSEPPVTYPLAAVAGVPVGATPTIS